MSTATMTDPATRDTAQSQTASARLSFLRVVRSEWLKLFTLRSTWWSLAITVALSVGISLIAAASTAGISDFEGFPPATVAVLPMQFTMLVAGILGAISVTGEYSTGMIRSTLAAEPRRGRVLLAKTIVLAVLFALVTALSYAIALLLTTPMLKKTMDWTDPSASWFPLLAGVGAMAAFALIGVGFGFLVRNGAGAITATVGVLFVLPIILSLFNLGGRGLKWIADAGTYLPVMGAQLATTVDGPDVLKGLLTVAAWPAAILILAWVAVRTRDA